MRKSLINRNTRMADKIHEIIQNSNQTHFFAFGYGKILTHKKLLGHFIGANIINELLEQKGYNVTEVKKSIIL